MKVAIIGWWLLWGCRGVIDTFLGGSTFFQEILILEYKNQHLKQKQRPMAHGNDQGRNQDFSKGGHTVPKRGYSPDFHVIFTTCCRLFA